MHQTDRVLDLLDTEWNHLADTRIARRRLRRWQHTHPILEGSRTLPELRTAIEAADIEISSEMMWALLDVAPGDRLADRFVLQVIVPGLAREARWLMSWARRIDRSLVATGEVDQMLIVAAIEAVRHAHGQRRAWPISSILRRTHRLLRAETTRIETWNATVVLDDTRIELAGVVPPDRPDRELWDLIREAISTGQVRPRDAELLWRMDIEGYSSTDLAPALGITPRSVAQRRWRAECRLTEIAQAAA